ncbi:hypothetical protein [Actinomadura roseirufa]|uniref:hypothetical protein n=1 Tax=Actinomadura roseirufa TaxID=2094049 RepID=UPI003522DD03
MRLAHRARDLVDHGTALEAARRVIIVEDRLAEAQRSAATTNSNIAPTRTPPRRPEGADPDEFR